MSIARNMAHVKKMTMIPIARPPSKAADNTSGKEEKHISVVPYGRERFESPTIVFGPPAEMTATDYILEAEMAVRNDTLAR